MYTGNTRKVIGVWVFTAYDDGNVDVTQTAPDKEQFASVREAIKWIGRWCGRTIRDAAKCPYSPDNHEVVFGEKNVTGDEAVGAG